MSSRRVRLRTVTVTAVVLFAAAALPPFGSSAQNDSRTVADGVYSEPQADRGAALYDAACGGCHRPDLGGGTGPALRNQRFAEHFAGRDLKTLFTRIAATMPRNAPASLTDSAYLDIVAHLLKENGFPAGTQELKADALEAIQVLPGRPKPPPPVGDFSYVEVVGCFSEGPNQTWLLTSAGEPVAVTPAAASRGPAGIERPLGSETIHLVDAAAYGPRAHKGHKVSVRGLLMKLPDERRMTISGLETVSPVCGESP